MGPSWVHLLLLVDTRLSEVQIALLHVRQGSEDVLLNHLHDLVEIRNDHANHVFLVLEHLLQLSDCIESLRLQKKEVMISCYSFEKVQMSSFKEKSNSYLAFDILLLILVVVVLHAEL